MLVIPFPSITLPQSLLSSFGSKRLGFMEKQVLWIIPHKYSEEHWLFLMFTITVFWLVCQCPLPDDNIHTWSEALSSFQLFVPHCSQNITQLLGNFQVWYSSHKFFYILSTHITRPRYTQYPQVWQTWRHQCQPSFTYKHKITVNIQQYCCSTTIQGFISLETRYISSGDSHIEKKTLSPLPRIKLPFLLSTSHLLCHYSDWASKLTLYQGIKNFQNYFF